MEQNWVDVPMVDVPPPPALRLPRGAGRGAGPVRYTVHTGKGQNHRCGDCLELFSDYYADGAQGSQSPTAGPHGDLEPHPGRPDQDLVQRTQAPTTGVGGNTMRLVCPRCRTDSQLYSLETVDLMQPVTASTDTPKISYTGDKYLVLDENAHYEGRLFCRCGEGNLRHEMLLLARRCIKCAAVVYRRQNLTEQIMMRGGLDTWRDAHGIPLCPGQAEPHQVAG